jgi:hypothetical protein
MSAAAPQVYYCDHREPCAATATIKAFAGDSVECHVKGDVLVVRLRQPVDDNLLCDLRGENCVLTPASPVQLGKDMTEEEIHRVMERSEFFASMERSGSVSSSLLLVDGHVAWARTTADAAAIIDAIQKDIASESSTSDHLPVGDDDDDDCSLDQFQHFVTFQSAPNPDIPRKVASTWAEMAAAKCFRDGDSYEFASVETVDVVDSALRVVGRFRCGRRAKAFVDDLVKQRKGGAIKCMFDGVVVTFETVNVRYEAKRIDAVEDINEGLRLGRTAPIDHRIAPGACMLSGPTQSGKSTFTASMLCRIMVVVQSCLGVRVIEGANPLADPVHDILYAVLRRVSPEAEPLPTDVLVPSATFKGLALPADHFIVFKSRLTHVPAGYELLPTVAAAPDALAVAKDNLGSSTTRDVHVYLCTVDGETGATTLTLLDTPGTHDSLGTHIDVRNAVIRQRIANVCEFVRMVFFIDFSILTTAAAGGLRDYIAPLACCFHDFPASVDNVVVLLTRFAKPSQMDPDCPPEKAMADVNRWNADAHGHVKSLLKGAVMNDVNCAALLRHLDRELTATRNALETRPAGSCCDGNLIGRATVVHPLAPARLYLSPMLAGADPLHATQLRASLGPKASAAMGRALNIERMRFMKALHADSFAECFAIAANIVAAVHDLEHGSHPVHYTEDACVPALFDEMAAAARAAWAKLDANVRAAILAGHPDAVAAARVPMRQFEEELDQAARSVGGAADRMLTLFERPRRSTADALLSACVGRAADISALRRRDDGARRRVTALRRHG